MRSSAILLVCTWSALLPFTLSSLCFAGLHGETRIISGGGCRFPDAAFNGTNGNYLIVWADYTSGARGVFGRRLNSEGVPAGDVFRISSAKEAESLFPAVSYNV